MENLRKQEYLPERLEKEIRQLLLELEADIEIQKEKAIKAYEENTDLEGKRKCSLFHGYYSAIDKSHGAKMIASLLGIKIK